MPSIKRVFPHEGFSGLLRDIADYEMSLNMDYGGSAALTLR